MAIALAEIELDLYKLGGSLTVDTQADVTTTSTSSRVTQLQHVSVISSYSDAGVDAVNMM